MARGCLNGVIITLLFLLSLLGIGKQINRDAETSNSDVMTRSITKIESKASSMTRSESEDMPRYIYVSLFSIIMIISIILQGLFFGISWYSHFWNLSYQ